MVTVLSVSVFSKLKLTSYIKELKNVTYFAFLRLYYIFNAVIWFEDIRF